MKEKKNKHENIAELICDLTRKCGIKEDYFASSFELTPSEVRLLKLFVSKSFRTVKEIKEYLRLTPGRITHILCSLESKGILKRENDKKDKRNVNVHLLPNSEPFISEMNKNYKALNDEIFKRVSKSKIDNIYKSLTILLEAFDIWIKK
jgi:DNA-binding MarR family transcriptional regulator